MKLLLNRDQKSVGSLSFVPLRFGSGNIFNLTAEIEFTEEEKVLADMYKINGMTFDDYDLLFEIKRAFGTALIPTFIVLVVLSFLMGILSAIPLSLIFLLIMTVVYYNTMHEHIVVRELLNGGRTFRCDSIVGLIKKEAYVTHMCDCLRQILESAKYWDDREVVDIEPLSKEDAKRFIRKNFLY